MQQGATGKFEIPGKANGIKVFITSVSPDLFLAFVSGVVNAITFNIQ